MTILTRVDPEVFTVKEPCSIRIELSTTRNLVAGDMVEFQFPNSWCLVNGPSFTREFQSEAPEKPHYVSIAAPSCEVKFHIDIRARNLPYTDARARHGRLVSGTIETGSIPAGEAIVITYANTFAPYVAETESVWIRVKGEAPRQAPTLTVRPGPGTSLRVIAPSGVRPGEPFDVLIVSLDASDNVSASGFRDESLCLETGGTADTVVASGLTFTGSIRVPVRLQPEGVHRFRFRETASNAVRVARGPRGPYWGDIHIHSKLSMDAQGSDPYRYARDVSGLDFAAVMDHCESLGLIGYEIIDSWAEEFNEPGRFATIPGDERNPDKLTGHHNLYFRDIAAFRAHRKLPDSPHSLSPDMEAEALGRLDPTRAMLIPHHTGINFSSLARNGIGCAVAWDAWKDTERRPVMEIYSHHGQSELFDPHHILAYEFNRMRNPERRANVSHPGPCYAQDYWMAGKRVGVLASSDEHSGQGGRRHGGIAAVHADSLSRESIFDAIRSRRCYATTGERILLDFNVAGAGMGEIIRRPVGARIPIQIKVWATNLLLHVEVLRFRFGADSAFRSILSEVPRPESRDACFEIEDVFSGPCMYYARIVQQPLEWPGMAWSSPIWVDPDGKP